MNKDFKRFLPDRFVVGILLMVLLGWLFPGFMGNESPISLSTINKYGVALLFFFYGLRLAPQKLKTDLLNWKLHVATQSITFIFFPLLVLLVYPFFCNTEYFQFWLAIFFMSTLPSTVSSSVVMVSIARGNIPGAIFNASISGILGIIFTPLWMGFFLDASIADFNLGQTLFDLFLQILAPIIFGLLLNKYWGAWALKHKKKMALFDKLVILSIVFDSFSSSFANRIFDSIPLWTILILSLAVIAIFFVVFSFSKWMSRILKFSREDQITFVFCGSKKSLVHGSVMASVFFAGSSGGGLFLVPIMIYHVFQLFYISLVAKKIGDESR